MARLESTDGTGFFELTPVHVSRSPSGSGDEDAVVCTVSFESYGEPVSGEAELTRAGITRMVQKLASFCEKRQGMMQLRSQTQVLELNLAAKRSKWTTRINVTGLAGVPKEQDDAKVNDELRVSFGVTYRQADGPGGSVEHRCGMNCTFDALEIFANAFNKEFQAAPTRRSTGQINPSGK